MRTALQFNEEMKRRCGDISITFINDHHFLEYDKDLYLLKMTGNVTDLARVYKDSKLVAGFIG